MTDRRFECIWVRTCNWAADRARSAHRGGRDGDARGTGAHAWRYLGPLTEVHRAVLLAAARTPPLDFIGRDAEGSLLVVASLAHLRH